jgi:hypothetical protein
MFEERLIPRHNWIDKTRKALNHVRQFEALGCVVNLT